jgi:hypothetical protein
MGGRNRLVATRHHQGEPLRVVAAGLDAQVPRFNRACGGAVRPRADGIVERAKGQIALVVGAGEPFGRHAAGSARREKCRLCTRL